MLFKGRIKHCVKSVEIRNSGLVRMQENTDQKKLRNWTLFTQCKALVKFTTRVKTFNHSITNLLVKFSIKIEIRLSSKMQKFP